MQPNKILRRTADGLKKIDFVFPLFFPPLDLSIEMFVFVVQKLYRELREMI